MLTWILLAVGLWGVAAFLSIYARCSFYCQQVIFHWRYLHSLLVRRLNLMTELLNIVLLNPGQQLALINETLRIKALLRSPMDVKARAELESALEDHFTKVLIGSAASIKLENSHLVLAYQEVQEDIRQARMSYNAVVRDLVEILSDGPDASIAPIMGFKPAYYFQLDNDLI